MNRSIHDYLFWRSDLSFEQTPVNEVDEMLFACIGKPDYTAIVPDDGSEIPLAQAVDAYAAMNPDQEKIGLLGSPELMDILGTMAHSRRYADVTLSCFVNRVISEETEQMSALTVHLPGGMHYVSFRGTDDTLIGWKENCELAIVDCVPAQRDALAYLMRMAELTEGEITVCGHSKGGNLAIYAAVNAGENVRSRIRAVYSYDGPGFSDEFLCSDAYLSMKSRITTYVPTRSIVGMLLGCAGQMKVISSSDKGIRAHDVFTWNVEPSALLTAPELSRHSRVFRAAIDRTLDGMDIAERQKLVEEVFTLLTSTGAMQLMDFTEFRASEALELAAKVGKAPELRSFLLNLSEMSLKEAVIQRLED